MPSPSSLSAPRGLVCSYTENQVVSNNPLCEKVIDSDVWEKLLTNAQFDSIKGKKKRTRRRRTKT